jgi:dynein heavy chain
MFYHKLSQDVQHQASVREFDFIRVIAEPLQQAIHKEAISWVSSIGNHYTD